MSYPRKIHTLIVEDEQEPTENYRDIFERLAKEYDIVEPPRFAPSVEDAKKILESSAILHLLILDLGLPLETCGDPLTGIEAGNSLIKAAANRDRYPVPAVVVISARLAIAKLTELTSELSESFWHGVLVNKGVDEDEAILTAIRAIHHYCDVGIHIRGATGCLCPTLSPREEDMLRRCVLSQPGCLGVDLDWWGEYQPYASGSASQGRGVTKVLAGNFLLDRGMGSSQTTFFKFRNSDGAAFAQRDAHLMVQKLSHVKVLDATISASRSLLVTQKVGDAQGPPISLSEYLRRDPAAVQPRIPSIVTAICSQLHHLCDPDNQEWRANRLLWQHHNREKLTEVWSEFSSLPEIQQAVIKNDPIALLDALSVNETLMFVRVQSCTHGDLNATNIALDDKGEHVDAYIFDAEGVHLDVDIRDLATLEVTSLLHHAADEGLSLVAQCADFYSSWVSPPAELTYSGSIPLVANTRRLLADIRSNVPQLEEAAYTIVVFDVALQQLGGLAWQRSRNKIVRPVDAALLAGLVSDWCTRLVGTGA